MMKTGTFPLFFAVVLKEVEGNEEEEAVLAAVGFGSLLTGCDSGTRRKPQYGQRTILGGRAVWITPARVHLDEDMIPCSM